MNDTELKLLAIHKGPAVPLDKICERYLNMSIKTAIEAAALNRLPFPTFRLGESRKAPLMVNIKDLATHMDEGHRCAKASWERSQV